MRPVLAALAAALVVSSGVAPAAQASAPAVQATQPTPGLAIADVVAWLKGLGAEVGEVQRQNGEAYVVVTDGGLNWMLSFYSCQADVCGDVQFSAVFANASITPDLINGWNRDQRYLKAFYSPAQGEAQPGGVVQYDVLLLGGRGADQLTDPLAVWLEMVAAFAVHVGYFQPAPTPAPAAQ